MRIIVRRRRQNAGRGDKSQPIDTRTNIQSRLESHPPFLPSSARKPDVRYSRLSVKRSFGCFKQSKVLCSRLLFGSCSYGTLFTLFHSHPFFATAKVVYRVVSPAVLVACLPTIQKRWCEFLRGTTVELVVVHHSKTHALSKNGSWLVLWPQPSRSWVEN